MAVGKTSTARSFISRGDYEVMEIEIAGKKYPYTYDAKKNYVVTGRYDRNVCGGMDGVITERNLMKLYLQTLMKKVQPKVILFEAVMYGNSFKFGYEMSEICRKNGYEYIGVHLAPDFEDVLDNMYKRNGGKQINVESLSGMYFSSFKATDKLRAAGIKVKVKNPRLFPLPELYKMIEEEI